MPRPHIQSVDEYIKSFPLSTQSVLKQIRTIMRAEMPQSQEVISYQIPCYKLARKSIIYFAGYKNHVSLYPIPKGDRVFQNKIAPYVKGKGTISFSLSVPILYPLVNEIVHTAYKQRVGDDL